MALVLFALRQKMAAADMQIPCLFVLLRNTVSFPNIDGLLQQNHLDSSGKRYYLGI